MSKQQYILDIFDTRHDDQRHQRYTHGLRARKNKYLRPRQLTSYAPKRSRSITRSEKAEELIDDQDYGYLLDEFYYSLVKKYYSSSEYRYDTHPYDLSISRAIRLNDVDFLGVAIRQLQLNHQQRNVNRTDRRNRAFEHYIHYDRHTMLTDALVHAGPQCAEVILDGVYDGFIYSTIIDHVTGNGRTALWYACEKGYFDLVRELVERAHANVNKCGVLLVALQKNHKGIVNYLLSQGCDPNRRVKNYNESALHIASRRNQLDMVDQLLKYGANPNVLDYKKRTPLDYAIHKKHIEIARILIQYHNGRFIMSQTGYTPLMLAASCNNKPIMNLLLQILPDEQILEEVVLLACRYTIDGNRSKRDEAYCYFEKALSRTPPSSINAPCEAYEFVTECQTLDELASIRDNDNKLRMYALVISERLLLQKDELKHLLTLIIKQSNVYRWQRLFHRCLQLRMYAYELLLQAETNRKYHIKICEEYLVLILLETKTTDGNERYILISLIVQLVHKKIIIHRGLTLLGYFVKRITSNANDLTCASVNIPTLSIIRLLIYAGADVNETNLYSKSTPLHLLSTCDNENGAKSAIQLLLDADAHIDCINARGYRPDDNTYNLEIKEFLRSHRTISLKCLCARLIVSNNLPHKHCLSADIIQFVQMHSREKS
ncbi:unnamed protein product [Adineta ricciae]|uniref:Uncharacterized protein n=1 Tax=Adineta ricciae TaxID=249248 RepID=A0A815AIL7_ADIRI|nr:unnamed protein product [Adineta ricciae]